MTADAERTITAPSEHELLAVLAALHAECVRRRAALRQVGDIRPYPGGGVFVRVRAVDRTPAPSYRRPRATPVQARRGVRPVVVVTLIGVLASATALALLAVLVFGELAAHWRPMLGVAVVVGLIALAIRGTGR